MTKGGTGHSLVYTTQERAGQHHSGPCSQVTNCQWGTIREAIQPRVTGVAVVRWRVRRGRFRPSLGDPPAHPALGQQVSWGALGTDWEAHMKAPEPSPRPPTSHGPGLEEQWTSPCSLSLWPNSSGRLPDLWDLVSPFGPPEEAEDQLGWMPGSLRDDSWEGCGNLALKELPTEIRLLLARTGTLEGESCALGSCPFWSGQRIPFLWLEIYRIIITWLLSDLKNGGADMEKFATTHHTHPSPFAFKGACWKRSVTLGFLGHEPPISLYEPVTDLSLFQTLALVLTGLTVRWAHRLAFR